jgi:hypothetical protein
MHTPQPPVTRARARRPEKPLLKDSLFLFLMGSFVFMLVGAILERL